MKLVLYSGGQNPENRELHQLLAGLCGTKSRKRLTYIPFCAENCATYFQRAVRRYRSYGFTDFHCLPVDTSLTRQEVSAALRSDVIYLAGGNTYYLLKHLKRSGVFRELRRFARGGGVLAGLSAGAIIMTANIRLAGIPNHESDDNDVALTDLEALGLVPFEFFPHYSSAPKRDALLLKYSMKTEAPIYACPDGGGIVLERGQFRALGRLRIFHRGRSLPLGI